MKRLSLCLYLLAVLNVSVFAQTFGHGVNSKGLNYSYVAYYDGTTLQFFIEGDNAKRMTNSIVYYKLNDLNSNRQEINMKQLVNESGRWYTNSHNALQSTDDFYFCILYAIDGLGEFYSAEPYNQDNVWQHPDIITHFNINDARLAVGEPLLTHTKVIGKSASSISLKVDALVDNIEGKVTRFVINGTEYNAINNIITLDGLASDTEYTFTIYAKYGNLLSRNYRTYRITTPKASACSGQLAPANGDTPELEYEFRYDEQNDALTVIMRAADPTQALRMARFWGPTPINERNLSAQSNGDYAYTITQSSNKNEQFHSGDPLIFSFRYALNTTGNHNEKNTFDGNNNAQIEEKGRVLYTWGSCPYRTEWTAPAMQTANVKSGSVTFSSVVLQVSASDDSNTVNKFVVTDRSSFATEYTANAAGEITLTGLQPCTDYTLYVSCKDDAGNSSLDNDNSALQEKEITFTTLSAGGVNLALGKTAKVAYILNKNELANLTDGIYNTVWHNDNATYFPDYTYDYVEFDLGDTYPISDVNILWNKEMHPAEDRIMLSTDGITWRSYYYADPITQNPAPEFPNETCWQKVHFGNEIARFVRMESTKRNSINNNEKRIRIYEFEIISADYCIPHDDQAPVITNVEFISATANSITLHPTATDDYTLPQNLHYLCNSDQALSLDADGNITITGLNPCTDYTFAIQAYDEAGNLSNTYQFTAGTESAEPVNLALGKTAKVAYIINKNELANLTDGIYNTVWHNDNATYFPDYTYDYVEFDLGDTYPISDVNILWNKEMHPAEDRIMLSTDGITWRSYYYADPITQNPAPEFPNETCWQKVHFGNEIARFVRMESTKRNSINNNEKRIRIYEFEIISADYCIPHDDQAPVITNVEFISATANSITLHPTATDDYTLPQNLHYLCNSDQALSLDTDGNITITGLTSCTDYTFAIQAYDEADNLSDTYKVVANTEGAGGTNLALNKTAKVAFNANLVTNLTDGKYDTQWHNDDNQCPDVSYDWVEIDLGDVYPISDVNILWNRDLHPEADRIMLSLNGTEWHNYYYDNPISETPATEYNDGRWQKVHLRNEVARYVRMESTKRYLQRKIRIYEFEVITTDYCLPKDNEVPAIQSIDIISCNGNSITLRPTATDDQTASQDLHYLYNGQSAIVPDAEGNITITDLTPCTDYTLAIQAYDEAGNISDTYILTTNSGNAPLTFNLALGRKVYSGYDQNDLVKENLVDGNTDTRWASWGRESSDDEWVVIDLGSVFRITRVEIDWETGASINYEFKSAYNAEFAQRTYPGANGKQFDYVVSGNFSTFGRYTDRPEGAGSKHKDTNDKDKPQGSTPYTDVYDFPELVYGRYFKLESGLNAEYPASAWEIRIFGECAESVHKPVMQWAEAMTYGTDHIQLYVSALDYETSEEDMGYEVHVRGGEPGCPAYDNIDTYHFSPSQFYNGETGQLDIGGLIPGIPYNIKIYAIDSDGNRSDNYREVNFTTSNESGCTYDGYETVNLSTQKSTMPFQKGYKVNMASKPDGSIDIVVTLSDNYYDLAKAPCIITPNGSIIANLNGELTTPEDKSPRTFTANIHPLQNNGSDFLFYVLFEFQMKEGYSGESRTAITKQMMYDTEYGCRNSYVIFYHEDKPTITSNTAFPGGNIKEDILLYRRFTPGQWHSLCVPFDVSRVQVYDIDDHRYYNIYPKTTTAEGGYYLRQQVPNCYWADFRSSWYDSDDLLPKKDVAYSFRLPNSDYYKNKYILFYGDAGQDINGSFTIGTRPTADGYFTVYANTTMMPQPIGTQSYLISDDGEWYERNDNDKTLYPFECYALANAATTNKFKVINSRDFIDTTTDNDNIFNNTDQLIAIVRVYTITGRLLYVWNNLTKTELLQRCASSLYEGCYLLRSDNFTEKILINANR
ncbi:MAG: discoidin domain-containing protein [Prevotella sp.]|nr:discoidin domain-containing protein [Prevotella sp.]